ncbi:MAG: nitrous oxide-stimulated promoter family protein [Clostridia bacterium]
MQQEKEIEVVTLMIKRYCRGKHKTRGNKLCADCTELLDYVKFRRAKCPYQDDKPFCSNCKTHCYKPAMRSKIREVMRYSGPRIIFRHPIISVRHLVESSKEKRRTSGNDR